METKTTPSLLNLPTELRTKILSYCLCHNIPTNLFFSIRGNNYTPSHLIGSNELYGESNSCNLPQALTQVCRQLRHETLRLFFSTHRIELGLWRENRWRPAEEWLKGILALPQPSEEDALLRDARDWTVTLETQAWPEGFFRFRIFAPWEVADGDQRTTEVRMQAIEELTWSAVAPLSWSQKRIVTREGQRHVLVYETEKRGSQPPELANDFLNDRLSSNSRAYGSGGDEGVQGLGAQDLLDLIDLFVTRRESADDVMEEGGLDIFG